MSNPDIPFIPHGPFPKTITVPYSSDDIITVHYCDGRGSAKYIRVYKTQ